MTSVHGAEIAWGDTELKRMKATIDVQLSEYCDLMDVKIKLDSQIATYLKLLESEETRINRVIPQGAPNCTPLTGRKRKAVGEEHTSDCEVTSMITDAIKIQTIDVDGKFIRLLNISPDREM